MKSALMMAMVGGAAATGFSGHGGYGEHLGNYLHDYSSSTNPYNGYDSYASHGSGYSSGGGASSKYASIAPLLSSGHAGGLHIGDYSSGGSVGGYHGYSHGPLPVPHGPPKLGHGHHHKHHKKPVVHHKKPKHHHHGHGVFNSLSSSTSSGLSSHSSSSSGSSSSSYGGDGPYSTLSSSSSSGLSSHSSSSSSSSSSSGYHPFKHHKPVVHHEKPKVEQYVNHHPKIFKTEDKVVKRKKKYTVNHHPVYHKHVNNVYNVEDTVNHDVYHHMKESEDRHYDVDGKHLQGKAYNVDHSYSASSTGSSGGYGSYVKPGKVPLH